MTEWNWRDFLRRSATTVAGASLLGPGRWAGANDRIRVAVLGLGNRGKGHIKEAASVPGVEVATLCDPDENRLQKYAAECESDYKRRPKCEKDPRRVLEDRDIDVISVATPNHWHALATIWACQAGKHVYAEKPVAHNMWESRRMIEAARKYDRIVAAGTQRRSNPNFQKAARLLREGIIGEIYMARSEYPQPRDPIGFKPTGAAPSTLDFDVWLGPAPKQPYHANLVHYNWHWFWDFGNGEIGNNGPHFLDILRWGAGKGMPTRIHSVGGRFGPKDQAETPNTQRTTFGYDDGVTIVNDIRGLYAKNEFYWEFYGSKGYMHMEHSDRDFAGCEFQVFMGRNKTPEPDMNERPSAKAADHYANFIAAVRAKKRELLNSELEEGHISGAMCLLANISYRLGREVRFDPKRERFVSDTEADRHLTREYRKPFVVPEKV
jgi:predicted dehydrogenase